MAEQHDELLQRADPVPASEPASEALAEFHNAYIDELAGNVSLDEALGLDWAIASCLRMQTQPC